jgi:hypothetical protein
MSWLVNMALRIGLATSIIILGVPVARAALPLIPSCSWPVESTGQGILNVATQDTNTTYWFMPIDTSLWSSITILGIYPEARAFNFTSYDSTGALIGSISDSQIVPDPGSINPFTETTTTRSAGFTIDVGTGSSNALNVGGNRLVFIVYRVVLPDQGLDKSGGVGVPTVRFVARDGSVLQPRPCAFASAASSFGNMIPLLIASGFGDAAAFLQSILTAVDQRTSIASSCAAAPSSGPTLVAFGSAPGTSFFPDPLATYLQTPNVCNQPQDILVVRGKAFVYPNTYLGGSVLQPAFDGRVQVRYWSMCNNDAPFPYPVLGCQADIETKLDEQQSYTYVVSDDPAPPAWLPDDATWLPWGATNIPITLIFRVFLPKGSAIVSSYRPQGATCNEALFISGGWQACFAAASTNAATTP